MGKNIVPVLTLTLITLVVIVSVYLFQTVSKSTVPEATQEQLSPLDPKIDSTLIEELESSIK